MLSTANYAASVEEARVAFNEKNYTKAVNIARPLAEQGEPTAQRILGTAYQLGVGGLPKSFKLAVVWYNKSADQNDALSLFLLGNAYYKGEGIPKSNNEAFKHYLKAANTGSAFAQSELGSIYQDGEIIVKNDAAAIEWFKKSAVQGFAEAQRKLALAYHSIWFDTMSSTGQLASAYFWALLAGRSQDLTVRKDAVNHIALIEKNLPSHLKTIVQQTATKWDRRDPEPDFSAEQTPQIANRDSPAIPITPPPSRPPPPVSPYKPDGSGSSGTGFYVTPSRIVTNHHVVDSCKRVTVNGGMAKVLSSDKRSDFALIEYKNQSGNFAKMRSDRVRLGEEVTAVGFPLQGLLTSVNVTRGNVSSLVGVGGDTRLLQLTAPVQPGNSGGPLIDGAGNLIGVIVSKLSWRTLSITGDIPQNVNFAINMNTLASFLDAHNVNYLTTSPGAKPLSAVEIAEQAKGFTVLIDCEK